MANINSWLMENRLLAGRKEVYDIGDNLYDPNGDYGKAVSAFSNEDSNVRVRELSLGSLTVEFDDESSKFATGDHTRDEAIAGITQGTIDFNMKLAPGQIYVSSATYGAMPDGTYTIEDATYTATIQDYGDGNIGLPYKKYLEGAGLNSEYYPASATVASGAVAIDNPGYWEFYPSTDADLDTLSMVIQDKASLKDKDTGDLYGIQYKIAGAMSTLTVESESAGKPFKMNFSYTGKVDSVYEVYDTSASPLNLLAYEDEYALSTIANKMLYTYITLIELDHDGAPVVPEASINLCVNKFSLDSGLTITPFQCQMDGSGIKYNAITSRDPRITIDPLLERVGPAGSKVVSAEWFKFWEAINSETTYAMSIRVFDGDPVDLNAPQSKELFAIIVPRAQTLSPNITDSDGYFRNELTFRPLRNIAATSASPASDQKEADYKIRIYGETKVV